MSLVVKQVAELKVGTNQEPVDYWLSADAEVLIVRDNLTPDQWEELGFIVERKRQRLYGRPTDFCDVPLNRP